ncbi:MAG: outer membrane beta-barrel protein [Flavobacteriales bacterium]
MKKLKLFLVLIVVSNTVISQTSIGLRTGIINSQMVNLDESGLGNLRESIETINSPYLGIVVGSSRDNRIRFAGSINYYRKGGKPSRAMANTVEGDQDTWYVYETYRINYLDFSSEIELKFSRLFFVSLGAYTASMLNFERRYYSDADEFSSVNSQITSPPVYDKLRKWDFGFVSHFGVEMKNSIRVELGFMRGLKYVFDNPTVSANSIKNQSFSFGLGYVFPISQNSKNVVQ